MWTHSEMVITYKPREEASEWNLISTLILDVPASRTIRNKCLFKPPSLLYFLWQLKMLIEVVRKWSNFKKKS